ncbi:phosphoribosylglycinamide formyltransferase [Thiofaba sp. EF100]|uniref:phosphoribosylglycinamide formyltransferase n=1 Tax=Thiofaba sp. EF100 TaxID=3121274 RepID=UPI0032219A7D
MCRIVVLISGHGSNLQALIDAERRGELGGGQLVAVFSNRADAFGLERARQAGIPTEVISHKDFPERAAFDAALMARIDTYRPDLVVLAGFMRILTPAFVQHYAGRLINIHPSLLPKYPGMHTHARAIEAGDAEHGATVHFVTEGVDEGPVILQGHVPVRPDDTPETLQQRVHAIEHQIYPEAVRRLCTQRLTANTTP